MGWNNFYHTYAGYADHFDTAVDRDYKVTRKGTLLATDYLIIPMEKLKPSPEYPNGYDLRDPDVYKLYDTDLSLDAEVESQARWDWHRRWFDPTWTPPEKCRPADQRQCSGPSAAGQADQRRAPDQLEGMAARVVGRYSPTGSEPASGLRNI